MLAAIVVTVSAVLHASPDPSNSSLSASSLAILANGSSTSTVTVTLRDAGNTQLTTGGNTVVVASTLGTVSTVTDNGDGTYAATLTSGTTVASAKVTATIDGTPVTTPLYVNFTTQLVTGARVDDVGTSNSIAAGNTSRNLAVGADGTIYAVFRGSDGIRVASSRNRGVSFGASVQVSADNLEAEVAVSTTGVVYVTWITGGNAVVSRSFDNGATWSAPVTAGPAGSSIHVATDASRVYLVDRPGNNFYWSEDNAATFTRVQLNAGEAFTDVHVDPLTGEVIVQVDNPSVKYLVSSDGGQTFSGKIQPSPAGSVFYSVGVISSGSAGRYLFVAGSGTNMYRIDMGAANVAGLTTTAVSQVIGNNTSSQGRSLASDRCGNIVVGYISGSDVKFDVSNDLGARYNDSVTVATATDANVYINQTNGDILFLYESGGQVSLSTYAGHLGNCYSPEVSVSTVAFSGVLVGQSSSPQSVRITNGGGVPVQVTGVTVSGDFASSSSCVGTLAVGASCEIPVTFAPTANGTRTGTLEIGTNIFVEPRVVSLTGVGLTTAPVATLSPTALNFGTVASSTTSAAQSVTLSNSGNQDLTITSFTMSGPFALSANTCGATVAPAASCTLSVTVTPTSTDAASGSLRLVSNASGAPPTVVLEVNGVPPAVTNAAPVAAGDAYSGAEDGTLTVAALNGVLANDTDADSDPLTAVLDSAPSHGTLALNANGSFTYAPTANYSGSDSFTYVASDGTVSSSAATVTITVTPVNDAPTLDQPAPITARWDAGAQTVTLTGITAGGEADTLTVTATSGTPATAIASAVTYGGGSVATFTVTPVVGRLGVVTITIAVNDGTDTTTRTFAFTVTAPPFAVTSVYPASGPDTGGTNIRITGLGFLRQATVSAGARYAAVVAPQVLIGGVPAAAAVVESGTVISAITPALPAGTPLDVQVIVPAGTGTLPAAFTPYARPAAPEPPTEPTDPSQPPPDPTNPNDPTAPTTDTDADGISDVWEEFYGTDPNDPSDASADPDGDGRTNKQEFDSNTHPDGRSVRYFAEGNAQAPFRTWVNLYNPSPIEAAINITFYLDDATVVHHLVKAAGGARTTVDTTVVAGIRNHAFGMRVDADESVVINRTITWNDQGIGAAAERGVELSPSWYFAEGTTHADLQTFALLTNPADQPVTVEIEYLVSAAGTRLSRTHVVPAHSRYTVWVNQEGPELADQGFGMVVRSSHPIVAERATYLTQGGLFQAGETSVGAPAAGQDWYFAEGAAGPAFNTFLLLANPTATTAEVQVRYLPEAGAGVVTTHLVAPYGRVTIPVSDDAAWEDSTGLGMHVHVTNGVDIVAERAMWWSTDGNAATWEEGHGSAGSTAPHTSYAIGDGVAGGSQGASTYLLLANPGTSPADVRVTLAFEDGTAPVSAALTIPAGRRLTVDAVTYFPMADGRRFSATIESVNSVPFLAEQSIYWTFGTGSWRSGVSLPATRLP